MLEEKERKRVMDLLIAEEKLMQEEFELRDIGGSAAEWQDLERRKQALFNLAATTIEEEEEDIDIQALVTRPAWLTAFVEKEEKEMEAEGPIEEDEEEAAAARSIEPTIAVKAARQEHRVPGKGILSRSGKKETKIEASRAKSRAKFCAL